MKLLSPSRGAAAALLLCALGTAQIERLDLGQMVSKADDAFYGTIVSNEVFKVDHPIDGNDLFYTTLTIKGAPVTRDQAADSYLAVTFPGGFIDDERGVYNSEAPSADETRVGTQIVAFYKWSDNMGGDVAANALYASHGGLYTTFVTPKGQRIVQGRGDGYAIDQNVELSQLRVRVDDIRETQKQGR